MVRNMTSRAAAKLVERRFPRALRFSYSTKKSAVPSTTSLLLTTNARSVQVGVENLARFQFSSVRAFSDKPPQESAQDDAKRTEGEEETTKPTEEEIKEEGGEQKVERKSEAEVEIPREEQLEKELKETKDQLLRSLAEQENTRRIAQRDVQDARNFAVKSFAKSLLDTSDNLTRAMAVVPEEMRHNKENNSILVNLYEGIEMTERELTKAFESNGLKKYGKVGDKFDPNMYSALYEYLDPEKEPGTVGQVIKPGFTLNDRVLRPAEVGVVKKE